MAETAVTIVGNLTADPALRFTQSGRAVAGLSIASTPRVWNRQTNEWEDGETLFIRGSVWADVAEHVASSLTKGVRVVVTGTLVQRNYETKEGDKRSAIEVQIDEVGASLRYATARLTKANRAEQGGEVAPTRGRRAAEVPAGQPL